MSLSESSPRFSLFIEFAGFDGKGGVLCHAGCSLATRNENSEPDSNDLAGTLILL